MTQRPNFSYFGILCSMKREYQVLLFYKYVGVEDPEKLAQEQRQICESLGLKGRIIVAGEGINATVEGLTRDTEKYIKQLTKDRRFKDIYFKKSLGTGNSFPKLSIKVREDIISGDVQEWEVDPNQTTGKYLTPEELHQWIETGKRFFIVDMRNEYEQAVGYFQGSILPPLTNFRDLPKALPLLKDLKNETIVTVCTGGVRCEKASGYLLNNGFNDVYQLLGGIVSYMEKYPNKHFLGKLYVFDNRVTMGFNTETKDHLIVGKCAVCGSAADTYYDCKNLHCQNKRHFISCLNCISKQQGYCSVCVFQ